MYSAEEIMIYCNKNGNNICINLVVIVQTHVIATIALI